MRRLAREAGDVDVLVNNAATFPTSMTVDQDVASYDQIFNANVRGVYFLTAALVPAMMEKGDGSIVNVTSLANHKGMPGLAAYTASKGAIAALTRVWAVEFGRAGVRVNTVAPGPTTTTYALTEIGDEGIIGFGRTLPLGRAGEADEVAEAVVFLASDRAKYITGATLNADGGGSVS